MNGERPQITGVILAGGRGTRMGGRDKGLIDVGGRPLIAHVLARLRPQVDDIVIVANRHFARYCEYGCTVVADEQPDYAGPLAGIVSALARTATPYALTVPCDGPYLPRDLAARLWRGVAATGAEIAVADNGERLQPLYALMHASLLPDLRRFVLNGERAVHRWYARHAIARLDFSDCPAAFANLNTLDDLALEASQPCTIA